MGLLRDTYIINKNDTSGQFAIAEQLKNKNNIEKEQMNTRDRVDISLQEYEQLKMDLQDANSIINDYQAFIHQLATEIECDPHILLKAKCIHSKIEKNTALLNDVLYLAFELNKEDL